MKNIVSREEHGVKKKKTFSASYASTRLTERIYIIIVE